MIGIVNVSSANYWEGMKQKIIAFICLVLWCGLRAYAQSPDVFQRDNIRMRMRQAAAWQLKNPQHELTDWTNGAFYAGLFAAYGILAALQGREVLGRGQMVRLGGHVLL